MADIKELREKMATLATNARSKFDEITDKTKEDRATEITAEFDAMMTEHGQLSATLERELKLEEIDRRAKEVDLARRPSGEPIDVNGSQGDDEPTAYREAFRQYMQAQGNIGQLPEEVRNVLGAGYSNIEQRAQTTTAAAGGYSIPDEMMGGLVRSMLSWGPMYSEDLCTVITTAGGASLPIPTVDDTAVTAGAHTEGSTLTDDGGKDVTFAQKTLNAWAFDTEWLRVSKELADDSSLAMETLLSDLLGERLGRISNLQLTTGTGSSAPNGIVTASTQGKVAASASAVTADELLDLYHSVDPAYRGSPKSRIMFNDAMLLSLQKLKDGQGNYLITEMPDGSGRLRIGAVAIPYTINQAMAGVAVNAKTIVYGDFSKYLIRKVGAPLIGAISDKDFWPGYGVAGYIRFDGELADTAAIKHLAMAAA